MRLRSYILLWGSVVMLVGVVASAGVVLVRAAPRVDAQPATACFILDDEMKERVRGVMLEALDTALKQQVVHVFEVWMKDERDQPARARTGTRQAVRAYVGARKAVVEWSGC